MIEDGPALAPCPAAWRPATLDDLPAILAIQAEVHTLMQERAAVFADKLGLFAEGCMILADGAECLGYGIAHPWRLDEAPVLDTLIGALPAAPDCLFVHDVALRRPARGQGAGQRYIQAVSALARGRHLDRLALISVYETYPLWARIGFEAAPMTAAKLAPYGETARYMTAPLMDRRSPVGMGAAVQTFIALRSRP